MSVQTGISHDEKGRRSVLICPTDCTLCTVHSGLHMTLQYSHLHRFSWKHVFSTYLDFAHFDKNIFV